MIQHCTDTHFSTHFYGIKLKMLGKEMAFEFVFSFIINRFVITPTRRKFAKKSRYSIMYPHVSRHLIWSFSTYMTYFRIDESRLYFWWNYIRVWIYQRSHVWVNDWSFHHLNFVEETVVISALRLNVRIPNNLQKCEACSINIGSILIAFKSINRSPQKQIINASR